MIPPAHGGHLVDRALTGPELSRREGELAALPKVHPFVDQLYDAEKIALGAYSPLEGFMGPGELESVLGRGRLANDLPWSIPILLPVPEGRETAVATGVRPGDEVVLLDAKDRPMALVRVEERFRDEGYRLHTANSPGRRAGDSRAVGLPSPLLGGIPSADPILWPYGARSGADSESRPCSGADLGQCERIEVHRHRG